MGGLVSKNRSDLLEKRLKLHLLAKQTPIDEHLVERGRPSVEVARLPKERALANVWAKMIADCFGLSICMIILTTAQIEIFGQSGCEGVRNICLFPAAIEIIEILDASKDLRVWQHGAVTKAPHVRFYTSAPLLLSDGDSCDQLGQLVIADTKPRESGIDQERLRMLADVVTSIILEWQLQKDDAVVIVDTTVPDWAIIASSHTWQVATKIYTGCKWWQVVECEPSEKLNAFKMTQQDVVFKLQVSTVSTGILNLKFAPAYKAKKSQRRPVLCKKGGASCERHLQGIFIVSTQIMLPQCPAVPDAVEGLTLEYFLGRGSYGVVYRASWRSNSIAVKIMPSSAAAVEEAKIVKNLKHSNVLETYDFREADGQCWMLLELCVHGSLLRCIDKGYYRKQQNSRVLKTCHEIAYGMKCLHDHDIIHGDLTANNVLLGEGMSAKVCDFGRSRNALATTATETYGTVTHMPPELISEGILSKASDVYGFGIILIELVACKRVYAGLRSSQVMAAKMAKSDPHIVMPEHAPEYLKSLCSMCTEKDYKSRPSFSEITVILDNVQHAYAED